MHKRTGAIVSLAASMFIFSTIGFFRNEIPLPSSLITCLRGIVSGILILLFMLATKRHFDWAAFRKHWKTLVLSGLMIGGNWMLLFEAYRVTTVAVATVCYYMAPVFLTVASFFFLHEKMSWQKILCVMVAFAGTLTVSGAFGGEGGNIRGVFFGLGAAVLYAASMLTNQRLPDYPTFDRTVVQMIVAGVAMILYFFLTEDVTALSCDTKGFVCLGILCLVHTAVAFTLFFASMPYLDAQTVAVYCYVDPVMAVVLSAAVFREPFGVTGVIGTVLILGATFASERIGQKQQ